MECVASSGDRGMNAFLLFCKRHRAIVRKKYPNLAKSNVSKILDDWWRNLEEEERLDFDKLAREYKQHVDRRSVRRRRTRREEENDSRSSNLEEDEEMEEEEEMDEDLDEEDEENCVRGERRSSSSSPELSSGSGFTHSKPSSDAPKPFKKRYLDAEKARTSLVDPEASALDSLEAETACHALLQLAGGVSESNTINEDNNNDDKRLVSSSSSDEASNDASTTNKVESKKSEDGVGKRRRRRQDQLGRNEAGFHVLRDAVWNNVARTLMKQEEEKGSALNNHGDHAKTAMDTPLNLSSQCLIRSQTIIEHVIENIIPEQQQPASCLSDSVVKNASNTSDQEQATSTKGNRPFSTARLVNNNKYCVNSELAEEIKRSILRDLKEDLSSDKSSSEGERIRGFLPEVQQLIRLKEEREGNTLQEEDKDDSIERGKYLPEKMPSRIKDRNVVEESWKEPLSKAHKLVTEVVKDKKANASSDSTVVATTTTALALNDDAFSSSGTSFVPFTKKQPFVGSADESELCRRRESPNLKDILATSPKIGSRSIGALSITVVPSSNPKRPAEPSPNGCDSVTVTPIKQKRIPTNSATSNGQRLTCDEDEEEDVRRSSRACKGKRYQEFRDEGIIVPKASKLVSTGSPSSSNTPASSLPSESKRSHVATRRGAQAREADTSNGNENNNTQGFDIMSRLKAIPARNLDHYHKKLVKSGQEAANHDSSRVQGKQSRFWEGEQQHVSSGQRRSSSRKTGST